MGNTLCCLSGSPEVTLVLAKAKYLLSVTRPSVLLGERPSVFQYLPPEVAVVVWPIGHDGLSLVATWLVRCWSTLVDQLGEGLRPSLRGRWLKPPVHKYFLIYRSVSRQATHLLGNPSFLTRSAF